MLVEAGQIPLLIVHIKILCPGVNPLTLVLLELADVTVPAPETIVHVPVPTVGLFALKFATESLQRFWLLSASAVVGIASTLTATVLVELGQIPLLTVHMNIFGPVLKLVIEELAAVGEFTVPPPEITDQVPVPVVGLVAASVALVAQSVWGSPALAVLGLASTLIATVLVEAGQVPLETDHMKIFAPAVKPVTPDVAELGVLTLPFPETSNHEPVPTSGIFALKVVVEEQIV